MPDLMILPSNASVVNHTLKPPIPAGKEPILQPDGAPSVEWLQSVMERLFVGYLLFVTPEMAQKFLLANLGNRSVRRRHLARIRDAMRNDEWKLTHQGVAFSSTGVLLDGQHRLMGIVASGVGVLLHIFVELPEDIRRNIDTGKPREMRDLLLDEDPHFIDVCSYLAALMITADSRPPSADEVQELIDALRPDLEALQQSASTRAKGRTTASIRASWALRHHFASKSGRALLRAQWAAFANFKPKDMDVQTSAMLSRLEHLKTQGGSAARERALIAWVGFDPTDRSRGKIQIKSDAPLKAIRAAVERLLEEEED